MKRTYTFADGERVEVSAKGLRELLAQNRALLANYEEMDACLDDADFVARGNGFCETQYSSEFIDGQIAKYRKRVAQLSDWLASTPVLKDDLRAQIRKLKAQHTAAELAELSEQIVANLEALPEFQGADTVLLYAALPDEVLTQECIARWRNSKRIVLPTVKGDDIVPIALESDTVFKTGDFNIEEPEGEPYEGGYDLMVIPGMAFDRQGNRLGRGRGYYDRFLAQFPDTPTVGICFPFQLLPSVPAEPLDRKVDRVITCEK